MSRSRNWVKYEYIPAIWTMNGIKAVNTGLPPMEIDPRPIWLLAGVKRRVFEDQKRYAEWSIVHADTQEQAMAYGHEDYDYGIVYAYLRPQQTPEGDANALFWKLVDKLDRLAQQGKTDREIEKELDHYNPMEPKNRYYNNGIYKKERKVPSHVADR